MNFFKLNKINFFNYKLLKYLYKNKIKYFFLLEKISDLLFNFQNYKYDIKYIKFDKSNLKIKFIRNNFFQRIMKNFSNKLILSGEKIIFIKNKNISSKLFCNFYKSIISIFFIILFILIFIKTSVYYISTFILKSIKIVVSIALPIIFNSIGGIFDNLKKNINVKESNGLNMKNIKSYFKRIDSNGDIDKDIIGALFHLL